MSEILETVTIKTDNGPVRINKTDFNPDVHQIDDAPAPVVQPVVDQISDANNGTQTNAARAVAKLGKKFVVVDAATGAPVVADGIDADGYATEADAWKAAAPQLSA